MCKYGYCKRTLLMHSIINVRFCVKKITICCTHNIVKGRVKGLTLIKTIERIFGRQSKRKLLIRFAWNMTREWSLTNTLLRFWVGRIDERRIFPFPSSLKMSDITNGFGKEYLTRFYLFSSFNENIEASLK